VLVAITLAKTLDPHSRLYGVVLNTATGIVHVVTVDEDMSQFVRSTE
jgi:hypothetical protein